MYVSTTVFQGYSFLSDFYSADTFFSRDQYSEMSDHLWQLEKRMNHYLYNTKICQLDKFSLAVS